MKTTRLNYGGKMPQEYDKTTPNIRLPRQDSEADFGKTVTGVYVPESEYPYQNPQPTQPPPQQYQQQPQPQAKGGVPRWLLVLAGAFGALFFLIAAILIIRFLFPNPGFTLIIKKAPPYSKVFIDKEPKGITTNKGDFVIYDLKAGVRKDIRVTCDGYKDFTDAVIGEDGEKKEITAVMAKEDGIADTTPTPTPTPKTGTDVGKTSREQIRGDLKTKGRVSVYGINFDFNKADLRPDSKPVLENIIAVLKEDFPNLKVIIEGHTDNKGSVQYNQGLSQRRAKSVMDYLIFSGIQATRLKSVGKGLSEPKESNDTEQGRAINRRVELVDPDFKGK